MPATTAKYAFPYPLGSDPVADGDNAIHALADRIEAVLPVAGQGYGKRFGSPAGFPGDGTWKPLIAIQLTGLPVGAVVAAYGSASLSCSTAPGTYMQLSFQDSSGLAHTGGLTQTCISKVQTELANSVQNLSVMDLFVCTIANNPTVALYGFANGGTVSVDQESHMIVTRLF